MRTLTTGIPLVFVSALLSAGPAFTQTTSPVANVYVQAKTGVYLYSADSAGQLTLVKGSPFAETGQMEGVERTFLITVGTDDLHSYNLESNGGVGGQASEINTQSYSGADCGTTFDPSILDHNGEYFSVQLYGATYEDQGGAYDLCSAWQTYKIASNGEFTFLGDTVNSDQYAIRGNAEPLGISTYSSSDTFAYGIVANENANSFSAYTRGAAGDLITNANFSQTGPTPNPAVTDSSYFPVLVAADPANHLAALVNTPFTSSTQVQVASFTINNSTGAVASTNTYANMPVLHVVPRTMAMSWTGNLVAVGGAPGLQIFHFNGAAPATVFGSVLLPSVDIDQLAWDKSGHLYALSYKSQELYVYDVTTTSITAEPGSPYRIPGAYGYSGLIVVPK